MDGSAFWLQPCPSRGVGLTHMHSSECQHSHDHNTCCHCLRSPLSAGAVFAPLPPVDIERRLNGAPDQRLRVNEEPRLATGTLLGPLDAPGRGPLTEAQESYLLHVQWMVDARGH